MSFWNEITFFKPSEFDSPDVEGSGLQHMDERLIRGLEYIRIATGASMRVNSGYRSPAHNQRVGGAESSQHLLGRAADIRVTDSKVRADMIRAADASGAISRVIVYSNFLHFDTKLSVDEMQVLWGKY